MGDSHWLQYGAENDSPGCRLESTTVRQVGQSASSWAPLLNFNLPNRTTGLTLLCLPHSSRIFLAPRIPPASNALLILLQELLRLGQLARRREESERRGDGGKMAETSDCVCATVKRG